MTKQTTPEPVKGSIVKDPEAVALHRICGLLTGLEPRARRRVLAFVADKFAENGQQVPPGQSDPRD